MCASGADGASALHLGLLLGVLRFEFEQSGHSLGAESVIPIPNELASEFQDYLERYRQRFEPEGLEESALVESLAMTGWRLARIPTLEESLFVRGEVEFAGQFSSADPGERAALIEAQSYLAYEKHFKLLSRQEAQLRRRQEQDEKRLEELQQKRRATAALPGQRAKLFLVPRRKGLRDIFQVF